MADRFPTLGLSKSVKIKADRFPTFSWGAPDCHSYYRNASGHAPFLFPGTFKEFSKLQDESGLHEYEVV